MKKLNVYGEDFIESVKEAGKLEDINDYYQVDSLALIKITKSPYRGTMNTNVLIGLALIKITKSPYPSFYVF